MPFDPPKRRPTDFRPHIVAPDTAGQEARCINCGASGWDIALGAGACDPDSDAAKVFRKGKRDGMVGRITGNSVR